MNHSRSSRLAWLGSLLALTLVGCLDPEADPAGEPDVAPPIYEETGEPEPRRQLPSQALGSPWCNGGAADDYTTQCCGSDWVYTHDTRIVCCPPGTSARYDTYADTLDRYTCGPKIGDPITASGIGISSAPVGQEYDVWVRWFGTGNWYLKSQLQAWGYPIYRSHIAALDLPPAYYDYARYQWYGDVRRRYRNGLVQTPTYKYAGIASWYVYSVSLYTIWLSSSSRVTTVSTTL